MYKRERDREMMNKYIHGWIGRETERQESISMSKAPTRTIPEFGSCSFRNEIVPSRAMLKNKYS